MTQTKTDGRKRSVQQKRGKRVSGEGLPGGQTVEIGDRRERARYISKNAE